MQTVVTRRGQTSYPPLSGSGTGLRRETIWFGSMTARRSVLSSRLPTRWAPSEEAGAANAWSNDS
jgi:hypothetical protein